MKLKKDVLKIEWVKYFTGTYHWMIVEQNYDVLPRGTFEDVELMVFSGGGNNVYTAPCYREDGFLYIRGTKIEEDENIMLNTEEEFNEIKRRVDAINKKYGVYMTFEECYAELPKIPYTYGEKNYYISRVMSDKLGLHYEVYNNEHFDETVCGKRYVSREDAVKLCEIFNKENGFIYNN